MSNRWIVEDKDANTVLNVPMEVFWVCYYSSDKPQKWARVLMIVPTLLYYILCVWSY